MSFYNMNDAERQILINQYKILKKGKNDKSTNEFLDKNIEYLEGGYIYLFENLNSLQKILNENESIEAMDILTLHDVIIMSANKHKTIGEELLFDFNNDGSYPYFLMKVIDSKDFPAFINFKVINSHGSKTLIGHKKQLNYWKSINKPALLNPTELSTILAYHQLP